MKAFFYESFGPSSVLKETSLPVPEPEPTEVLLKVHATGVNPVDWKIRAGYIPDWPHKLPIVPGWDVAGEVVADSNGFRKGDRVLAYTRPAGFMMNRERSEAKGEVIDTRTGT